MKVPLHIKLFAARAGSGNAIAPPLKSVIKLQQGFATSEMRLNRHFAWQQSSGSNVRFGSKADIAECEMNVRFTPESHRRQGDGLIASGCMVALPAQINNKSDEAQ
jgi:hypothetical protein